MTRSEIMVLELLDENYMESCLYTLGVVNGTGLGRLAARRAIKSLVRRGYVELSIVFDDDGMLAGSGYGCTPEGHAFARAKEDT
jgi:hypothetical protein